MNWNAHSSLLGAHAFLSPSGYHWLNYDEDKLDRVFFTTMAARRGVELHAFAHEAIRLGVKLPDVSKTLNLYVNDAIGYRMETEVCLYYSDNCFGHADSIGFRNNTLRIHDLKTGVTEASIHQLEVYMALFCLEYRFRPFDIQADLRIYQNDAIQVLVPDPDVIVHIMEKIRYFDKRLAMLREEES